jgi:hypothetical protein
MFPAPQFLLLSVLSCQVVTEHILDFPVEVSPGSVLAFYNCPVVQSEPPAFSFVSGSITVVDHGLRQS